jgi:outer membrane protein TolC
VERVEVGQAAVTRAHETQRIVRDRYASGMASVTEVLRSAEAALEAEFQRIGARVDVLVQRAALDRARGQL